MSLSAGRGPAFVLTLLRSHIEYPDRLDAPIGEESNSERGLLREERAHQLPALGRRGALDAVGERADPLVQVPGRLLHCCRGVALGGKRGKPLVKSRLLSAQLLELALDVLLVDEFLAKETDEVVLLAFERLGLLLDLGDVAFPPLGRRLGFETCRLPKNVGVAKHALDC